MQSVQAECPNVDRLHVRGSCFVTFLVLIPKSAIRVRRDEANGHNDSSRSSMPRHASESKWTWMHVLASSCESCHCDRWLRLVSLLWQNWESGPERSRSMIHEHQFVHMGALSLHSLHVTPLLHRNGMTCNLRKLSATLSLHKLNVRHFLRGSSMTCNLCKLTAKLSLLNLHVKTFCV